MLQNAIDETRQLMNELRPPMLDDFGIISSIRWFTDQFGRSIPINYGNGNNYRRKRDTSAAEDRSVQDHPGGIY